MALFGLSQLVLFFVWLVSFCCVSSATGRFVNNPLCNEREELKLCCSMKFSLSVFLCALAVGLCLPKQIIFLNNELTSGTEKEAENSDSS